MIYSVLKTKDQHIVKYTRESDKKKNYIKAGIWVEYGIPVNVEDIIKIT